MASESNPNLRPFGETVPSLKGLSAAEQAELGPHERIACVWPLLVRLCVTHAGQLKKQGIVIVAEDLIQELAATLVERDAKWRPERGKYTTFVGCVWRNVRERHDECRGVVVGPNHAWTHLKKLRAEKAAGTITRKKTRTLHRLEALKQTQVPLQETR